MGHQPARRDQRRRHDGRLGRAALRNSPRDQPLHPERSGRREPRPLRRLDQATGEYRVGVGEGLLEDVPLGRTDSN